MTTLSQFELMIARFLGETSVDDITGGVDLVLDGIAAAHDAILPWVPKSCKTSITGDGSSISFDLPLDSYEIQAVVADSGEIVPHATFNPGYYIGDSIDATNNWLEYPDKSITLSKALGSGQSYSVYYIGYWTKPDSSSLPEFILEPPSYALTGMLYYASAFILLPQSFTTATVRQFNMKVDSGTPEQNPIQKHVDYLLKLFASEMTRCPKYQRAPK